MGCDPAVLGVYLREFVSVLWKRDFRVFVRRGCTTRLAQVTVTLSEMLYKKDTVIHEW